MKDVTFIIAAFPDSYPQQAIDRILALDYPKEHIEILLARGRSPSLQRNQAALQARGEFLYFLDDDSFIDPHALKSSLKFFEQPMVAAVGGPALTHERATRLEHYFGAALASGFGAGPARARSRVTGEAREVRGEELILCNMIIRRKIFLGASGFNVALYPNEENELLKRLRRSGYRFFYDPRMIIERPRRKLIRDFMKQMRSYGKGRAQHLFKGFTPCDLIFVMPSLFVLYLLTLPFVSSMYWFLPLALYLALAFGAAIRGATRAGSADLLIALPLMFPLMHIAYGFGVAEGVIRGRVRPSDEGEIFVDPIKAIVGVS